MKVIPFFSQEEKGAFEPGLLHLLPDFAFGFDPATLKFLYANPACESFLGLEPCEVLQHTLSTLVSKETLLPFLTSLKDSKTVKARLEFVLHDGRKLWGEFHGRIRSSSDPTVWGVCRDITEQVQLENQLQDLLSVRDQLLVVVSHDLRSAFSGILSVSEILGRDEKLCALPENREYIDILQSSAHQTQLLMENLLHWAQAQRRGRTLRLKWMNAAALADHLMDQFTPLARMKKLQLNAVYSRDIPIQGDEDLLNVILRNLLNNAIKFTRSGGLVTLSIHSLCEAGQDYCEIAVEDSGVGISKEVLEQLRAGVEISSRGTGKEMGHGVGLRICRDFLVAHGSRLKIESVQGEGSRFSFRLPIVQIPSS